MNALSALRSTTDYNTRCAAHDVLVRIVNMCMSPHVTRAGTHQSRKNVKAMSCPDSDIEYCALCLVPCPSTHPGVGCSK
jgi:hypothetical protein